MPMDDAATFCPMQPLASIALTFATDEYFRALGRESIYPEIAITFTTSGEAHYHLPLLLSDNSYTTYRGS